MPLTEPVRAVAISLFGVTARKGQRSPKFPLFWTFEPRTIAQSPNSMSCYTVSLAPVSTIVTLAIVSCSSGNALACDHLAPWSRLTGTAAYTFTPLPLSLIAASPVAPLVMAPSNADHELRLFAQQNLHGRPNAEQVSVVAPFALPIVVAAVDGFAHAFDACDIARPSSAMLQAMGITLVVVSSLKVVTGRSWPAGGLDPSSSGYLDHPEFSRRFNWFSWNQGTSWPSGHTAIMVTAATALSTVQYGRSWVGYVAYAGAGGVAAAMWLEDHHWASDIISGALIGVAVGRSVGLAFREEPSEPRMATVSVMPMVSRGVSGVQAAGSW